MREFLAIVGDTWRQSKSQVVFIVMIVLLAVLGIAAVALTAPAHLVEVRLKGEWEPTPGGVDPSSDEDDEPPPPALMTELPGHLTSQPLSDRYPFIRDVHGWSLSFVDAAAAESAAARLEAMPEVGGAGAEIRAVAGMRWAWSDQPLWYFDRSWKQTYVASEDLESGKGLELDAEQLERRMADQEQRLAEKAQASPLQRSAEELLATVVSLGFTIGLLLFIGACAGYFPGLLAEGAVDVVITRPVSRLSVYLGKYFGGLVLFALVMTALVVFVWIGVGLRLGIWHPRVFVSLPVVIFAAGVLYAILAMIGTVTRSATLSVIVGYVFYMVVDSLLTILAYAQYAPKAWEWLKTLSKVTYYGLPNFGLLKGVAVGSVVNVPYVDLAPIGTAAAWMLGSLGLGYLWFRRRDF